jgi:transcriptional regulator with GAF, ATPase, and Fis domain
MSTYRVAAGPRKHSRSQSGEHERLLLPSAAHDELEYRASDEATRYGDLLGTSPIMRELFAQLLRLEGSKVNLLVSGESGTGKELIAHAVHEHSLVRAGPFVALNCGALDRQLARSELFGHERGAFTGAVRSRKGAFEAADGGTLFLDEVGELPCEVQPLLLRALEQRKVTPVGSHEERPVDVRLITATNRDLAARVRSGSFREDLYYRIHVVHVVVPPLRERPGDVIVLARDFAERLGVPELPTQVLETLAERHWPGNVRELRNAVEAYVALGVVPQAAASDEVEVDAALDEFIDSTKTYAEQKSELLQRFTRSYLSRLLRQTGGNQSEAARISGLERSYLGRLLDKLALRAQTETGQSIQGRGPR